MVQRHPINADSEQLEYTPEILKKSWDKHLDSFSDFAKKGLTTYAIVDFINWIRSTIWSSKLFPGSSVGRLLISKPKDGRLNYQQTLSIEYNKQTDLYTIVYSDWDLINSSDESEKAILWTIKCSGIELPVRFLEFLEWNKNWC